jgi:hypothetical protein
VGPISASKLMSPSCFPSHDLFQEDTLTAQNKEHPFKFMVDHLLGKSPSLSQTSPSKISF